MYKLVIAIIAAGALILGMCSIMGCNEGDKGATDGVIAQKIDSVPPALMSQNANENEAEEAFPGPMLADQTDITNNVTPLVAEIKIPEGLIQVNDVVIEDNRALVAHDGGFLVYDFRDDTYTRFDTDDRLTSIAEHVGSFFVGGDYLYRFDGVELLQEPVTIRGTVRDLCSYGPSLMIGTTQGLVAQNVLGTIPLIEDMAVTTLEADDTGLWVGTEGEGLFRWNGDEFQKRYLQRDSSLFDFVTAMDYRYGHLYLGTQRGLFVYDGGRWEQMTTEEGLLSDVITAVDASDWTTYVGTAEGLMTLHDGTLKPADKLGNHRVTALARKGIGVIAGSTQQGLVQQSGPVLRTLVGAIEVDDNSLASVAY